jgi:5-methylcytosine-specific restriction endonuclease McrA
MGRLQSLPPRIASLPARIARPDKVVDPFYESNAWRQFVREIKRQRGYVCEALGCGRDCSATPRGLIGDHIVERRDGGADFDPLNVMLMCTGCHNRKTVRERMRRERAPL